MSGLHLCINTVLRRLLSWKYSYIRIKELCGNAATGFCSKSVQKGDKISAWDVHYDYLALFFGIVSGIIMDVFYF